MTVGTVSSNLRPFKHNKTLVLSVFETGMISFCFLWRHTSVGFSFSIFFPSFLLSFWLQSIPLIKRVSFVTEVSFLFLFLFVFPPAFWASAFEPKNCWEKERAKQDSEWHLWVPALALRVCRALECYLARLTTCAFPSPNLSSVSTESASYTRQLLPDSPNVTLHSFALFFQMHSLCP